MSWKPFPFRFFFCAKKAGNWHDFLLYDVDIRISYFIFRISILILIVIITISSSDGALSNDVRGTSIQSTGSHKTLPPVHAP